MATLIKQTAVICLTEEEFKVVSQFRNIPNINEFYHVKEVNDLEKLDSLSTVIYLGSAKNLEDFENITAYVNSKGVSQKWQ